MAHSTHPTLHPLLSNLRESNFRVPHPTSQTRKGAGQRRSSGALIPLPDPLQTPFPNVFQSRN